MKIRTFFCELKRAMNFRIILGVMGVIFCICFDSWNDLLGAFRGNVGNVHYFFWNSAYGGVCREYFLPVFSAIPFAVSFCKEYNENVFPFIVSREGKTGYCIMKYVANALCGGVVVACGTLILFILLAARMPIANMTSLDVASEVRLHFWISMHDPFLYGVVEVVNGFLTGLLWSSIALSVSGYIPNTFVVIMSPYLMSFVLVHTFRLTGIDSAYWFTKWLTGYSVIGSSVKTMGLSVVVILTILGILGVLFTKKVRRRIENDLHQ